MAEEAELSAQGDHRFCLIRVLGMDSSRLMTGLAGDAAVIALLFLRYYRIMTSRARIRAGILDEQIRISLR